MGESGREDGSNSSLQLKYVLEEGEEGEAEEKSEQLR